MGVSIVPPAVGPSTLATPPALDRKRPRELQLGLNNLLLFPTLSTADHLRFVAAACNLRCGEDSARKVLALKLADSASCCSRDCAQLFEDALALGEQLKKMKAKTERYSEEEKNKWLMSLLQTCPTLLTASRLPHVAA